MGEQKTISFIFLKINLIYKIISIKMKRIFYITVNVKPEQ